MSQEQKPALTPPTSPMDLVDPESLNILVSKLPQDRTDQDVDAAIRYLRAERARFAQAEADGKRLTKSKSKSGADLLTSPVKPDLSDLDLNI